MARTAAIVLVILVAVGATGWFLQREHPNPGPTDIAQQPLPPPMAGAQTPGSSQPIVRNEPVPAGDGSVPTRIAMPLTLDNSDATVRNAAHDLAPKLVQWLTPEEQLRKWVALVDGVAEGKLPDKNPPLKYPLQGFSVITQGEDTVANPTNYQRANVLIEIITAIPPRKLADYYRAYSPLLERAYAELGRGGSFDARLALALRNVIAVQSLPADAKLARPKFYYTYADPALEQSSEVAKWLWRQGPANQHQLQSYLGELLTLL
jgi:hypothetical protein